MFCRHRPAHLFSGSHQTVPTGSSELATGTLSNLQSTPDRADSVESRATARPAAGRFSSARLICAGVAVATALSSSVLAAAAHAAPAAPRTAAAAGHATASYARASTSGSHTKHRRPRVPSYVLAHDYFSRDVSRGFGSAWVGGRYTLGYNGRVPFSVNPRTHGVVRLDAGSASASLMSVHARDVDVRSTIVIPVVREIARNFYHAVEARKQVNRDAYRGKVMVSHTGRVSVSIARRANGGEVGLAERNLGIHVASGMRLHVELAIAGTSPVTLKVRAWTGREAVPAWQLTTTDAGHRAITSAGAVGLWDYVCSGCPATVFHVRSFFARALKSNPRRSGTPGPAPTPSPSPTSSSPSPSPTSSSPSPSATSSSPSPSPTSSSPSPSPTSSSPSPSPTSSGPTPPSGQPRGSLPIGTAVYPVPANALYVSPNGSDSAPGTLSAPKRTLAGALKKVSPGQTIVLRAGIYHETDFVPDTLAGITIENYPGETVWFDGSVPVTNWTQSGSTWVSNGWTAQFDHSASFTKGSNAGNFVLPQYPMAAWPDMVFVDGVQLKQVASPSAVVPGTFAVDYANQTLTIGSDPSGHQLRASDLSKAITVSAQNVTIRGIGFRRYANSLPTGGALYFARNGDVVENVVVEDMATQGISLYKSNLVTNHVTVTRSGMLGITGYLCDNSVTENSVITASNTEHFNKAPSSAGIKVDMCHNITIRNNQITGGYDTHGIWTDGSTIGFTIVGNDLSGNGNSPVIQVEESSHGIVADNRVFDGTMGVYVFDTSYVEVYDNTFGNNATGSVYIAQDARRAANYGLANPDCTWVVYGITVSNNVFNWNGGPYGFQVLAFDGSTFIPASQMGLTINGNLFHTRTTSSDAMVAWGGSDGKTTKYDSPAALDSGTGNTWTNAQVAPSNVGAATATTKGVPLPADVATAIGQPAGLRAVGAQHD